MVSQHGQPSANWFPQGGPSPANAFPNAPLQNDVRMEAAENNSDSSPSEGKGQRIWAWGRVAIPSRAEQVRTHGVPHGSASFSS